MAASEKPANAIMIAIGKAKRKPGFAGGPPGPGPEDKGSDPDMSDDDATEGGASDDEVTAMEAFTNAKSAAEKADALKTFIQLCTKDY